ncbi:hypothetical protein [Laceyella putida]|uniref:Arc family DNA-binding protein n=1 Tax=Laceyella putida TaxID=110101 RepID=A0ABW2RQE3_9BACL
MDLFLKFVEENVDRPQGSKVERVVLLPKEMDKEFAHYCRKRNLSFNEAIIQLMAEALKNEKRPGGPATEENGPNANLFMNDAL